MNSIWNHRTGRRRLWRPLLLFGILLLFLVPAVNVRAQEGENQKSIQVTFEYTAKCYPVKVTVSGNGTLIDGEQTIRDGTLEYELLPGTVKWFEIKPDADHTLEDLFLINVETGEKVSIKDTIVDGKFPLTIENKEIVLEVVFSTKDTGTGDTGKDNGSSGGGSTGDSNAGGSSTGGSSQSTAGGSGSGTSGKDTGSGGAKTMDMTMAAGWMFLMFLSSAILMITVTRRKSKYL